MIELIPIITEDCRECRGTGIGPMAGSVCPGCRGRGYRSREASDPSGYERSDQQTESDKSRALSPLPNVPVDGRLRAAQVQSNGLEIATGSSQGGDGGPTRAPEAGK